MASSKIRSDPRLVYGILLLVITIPILTHSLIPVPVGPTTRALYDFIQNLPPNSLVVESFDYATSVVPELHPQAIVVTEQLFLRPLKVLFVALDANGPPLADAVIETVLGNIGKDKKVYGVDYANLGYIPNTATLIGMTSNIAQFLPIDRNGTQTSTLPIIKAFPAAKQASLVITYDDDSSAINAYLQYWQGRFNVRAALGATAVLAPGYMPFYGSGQLVGLLISMRAAAEYEILLSAPPPQGYRCCVGLSGAGSAMVAQSTSHLLIIGMVVFANVAYFIGKKRSKSEK